MRGDSFNIAGRHPGQSPLNTHRGRGRSQWRSHSPAHTGRTAANVKISILARWVIGNKVRVCLRAVKNDSHTRWRVFLPYCHTERTDQCANSNE